MPSSRSKFSNNGKKDAHQNPQEKLGIPTITVSPAPRGKDGSRVEEYMRKSMHLIEKNQELEKSFVHETQLSEVVVDNLKLSNLDLSGLRDSISQNFGSS